MNDTSNPNRPRRTSTAGNKEAQFDAAEARSKRPVAEAREDWIEHLLDRRGDRRIDNAIEGGTVNAVYIRRLHDPLTGRTWDRVFLFPVDKPEDFEAAEAWLNEHYPVSEGSE